MNYSKPERVGAFIIRKAVSSRYELLLFKHLDFEEAGIQVPGGGIEPGESIEAALYREIDEESGLKNLKLIRKLGVFERCWLDTHLTSRRHYFLLEATAPTLDRWEHKVCGNGSDAGLRFLFFWQRPPIELLVTDSAQFFLNPKYIPELYP